MSEGLESVSVVIPVRNGTKYVLEAIDSCLHQTLPVREIVVVDDGSIDGTPDTIRAARHPNVRVLEQTWKGTSAALNAGIMATDPQAAVICFLDHDDVWMPHKTALQLEALRLDRSLDAVFGHILQFVSPELTVSESQRLGAPSKPQAAPCISTMMIHRSALRRFGDFLERPDAFAFAPWYLRAQRAGIAVGMLGTTIAKRRIHLENATKTERRHYEDAYLELARAAALNRRGKR